MAKSIYIMSTAPSSGKTAVAIGLFLTFKENGNNPGYFKPIGDPFSEAKVTKADKDVNVVHRMLERKYSREEICPIFISPSNFLDEIPLDKVEGVKKLIKDTFDDLSSKLDFILIEGNHSYNQFYSLGLTDIVIAKILESDVVLVSKLADDSDLDSIIIAAENIKEAGLNLKGVIFDNVPMLQVDRVEEVYTKILKDKNIELLGVNKKSKLLAAATVAEVFEATNGKMLTENFDQVKDNYVEQFIIGAMQTNDALRYMRKKTNLGVITGGDRSDIILTAVEVGASLIILTGNLEPEVMALAKAKDAGIPVILVNSDTYTTAHQIQNIKTQIQMGEIDLCKQQVKEGIDWKKLL